MTHSRISEFALVTHSAEVAAIVSKCIDPESEHLTTRLVDLDKAVPTAKTLLQEGFDVIIGHGGTGATIAQNLGQQVVNIPTTAYEVLNALIKAKAISDRIAVTSFSDPRDEIEILEKLLNITILQIIYRTGTELERGIYAAIDRGFRVIVGGGVSRSIVQEDQGHVIIIEPSPKLVHQALIHARAIVESRRREVEYSEQLKTTLNVIADGLVGVDNYGRLNFYNPAAQKILQTNLPELMGQSLSHVLRDLGLIDVLAGGKAQIEEIHKISGKDLVVNSLPIRIDNRVKGAVALFREAHSIHNIDRKLRERLYLKGFVARHTEEDIKGSSSKVRLLIQRAKRYAQVDAAILIQGETGTGKEVLAHTIHNLSIRRDKPFVAVNCSAIPESLLESELFGYEDGAFTGAKKGGKIGLFELAHHGTIFLDEIADISAAMQVRLLRVLEAKEVMRVGGDRILPVNVRIISSSHQDLRIDVQTGKFRADLFFRLSVLRLKIPPLRERMEDIPAILEDVFRRHGRKMKVSKGMYEILQSYEWPGNIRELLSAFESYLILAGDQNCDEQLLNDILNEIRFTTLSTEAASKAETLSGISSLKQQLEAYEKSIINQTLKNCRYNRKIAAETLGISLSTLWRKLPLDTMDDN